MTDSTALSAVKGFGKRLVSSKPLLVLVGAVVIAWLTISTRPERPPVTIPKKTWTVDGMTVIKSSLRPTLSIYGRIESPLDATLSSAIEGDVNEVSVSEGETVAKDQVLIVLDDSDAQLDLIQRSAEMQDMQAQVRLERQRFKRNKQALSRERELLALAEKNYARAETLLADKLFSQANVDDSAEALKKQQLAVTSRQLSVDENDIRIAQLSAQLKKATALRDRAQLNADRATIKAPFDGVVTNIQVSPGDRARSGDELISVYNDDNLRVRAQLPTKFAATIRRAIRSDDKVPTKIDIDGRLIAANLVRLAGKTNDGSGTVESFIDIDEVPEGARVGSSVKVLVSLPPEPDAIEIPAEAIYGRNTIYELVDDRISAISIERLGEIVRPDGRTGVVVRSTQLDDGDLIVVTKLSNPSEGLQVELRQPEPPPSLIAEPNKTSLAVEDSER